MSKDALFSIFWFASLALNVVLAAILMRKGTLRKFPLFSVYAIFALVGSIVTYGLHQIRVPYAVYFYTYWVRESIAVFLGLAVVYEIFKNVFTPYAALRRLATMVFLWAIFILLLLGLLVVYAQSATAQSNLVNAVLVVEEATRVIEVGLLMFLFLFSTAFGLHWRQYVFGMALGLGIFATVELFAIAIRTIWGSTADHTFAMVRTVAFNLSLMLWLGYLLAPEMEVEGAELPHSGQLEQWNEAIRELIYQ